MLLQNLLIALAATLAGVVFYWQKDKSSFLAAAKKYSLLFVVVFVVTAFFTGYLLSLTWFKYLFQVSVAFAIIFFWDTLSGLFKKK